MGKINDSILAGTSGRTGRIVVANVNGLEYTRIRPRRTSKPPTPKQLLVQQRLKNSIAFMLSYRAYACKFFGHRVGAKSPYNQAMTNILDSFVINFTTLNITVNYPNIAFSKGFITSPIQTTLTKTNPTTLVMTWQDNSGGNPDRENDLLQILVVAEDDNNTYFLENAAIRSTETYTMSIPSYMQGKTLHVYLAFKDANDYGASNSHYAGSIV